MLYLKIGNAATSFTDVANNVSIVGNQVVSVMDNIQVNSAAVRTGLGSGYLVFSNQTEYDAWVSAQPAIDPVIIPSGEIANQMLTGTEKTKLQQIIQSFS